VKKKRRGNRGRWKQAGEKGSKTKVGWRERGPIGGGGGYSGDGEVMGWVGVYLRKGWLLEKGEGGPRID